MSSNTIRQDLKKTQDSIDDLRVNIGGLEGQIKMLIKQIEEGESREEEIKHKKEIYTKGVEVLDLAQKSAQVNIKHGFEAIVTYALQYILGSDYVFELDFGRRGNLQEVGLNIKSQNLDAPYDPLDTSGGGVLDIVSLALRVAILELHKPKIEGPIILDESFKHLSRGNLITAGDFLNALAKRVGRQIIMVTHQSELVKMADNTIEVK